MKGAKYFEDENYVEGSDNSCPSGYQRITDRMACDAANLVLGRIPGISTTTLSHYARGEPFETADNSKPCGCFRLGNTYHINYCPDNKGKSLKDTVMYCKSETTEKGSVW